MTKYLLAAAAALLAIDAASAQGIRRNYAVYQVRITGPAMPGVVGATAFDRVGYVYVTTTITRAGAIGDVNAVDFFLTSGLPAGRPEAGAIYYATNSAAARDGSASFRGAALDLASSCKASGGTVTAVPYTVLTRQYLYFTARAALTASLYMIESGGVQLTISKDLKSLVGGINLLGRSAGYPTSTPINYRAVITGKLIGTVTY